MHAGRALPGIKLASAQHGQGQAADQGLPTMGTAKHPKGRLPTLGAAKHPYIICPPQVWPSI